MALHDERIRELWNEAQPFPEWRKWIDEYLAGVQSVQSNTVAQLATVEGQRTIWNATGLGGIGPGSAVVIPDAALSDPDVAGRLARLRGAQFPGDVRERAKAIGDEYEQLLSLLASKYTKKRPQARLLRAFAALIPGEMHCAFSVQSQRNVAELLVPGWRDYETVEQHVLGRARLRDVLGPERNPEDHALRSVFCWWLHENRQAIEAGGAITKAPAEPSEAAIRLVTVLPFHKQFKGNFAITRMTASYRDVVQACLPGITRDDLVEALGVVPEFRSLSKGSLKQLSLRVIGLGLLQQGVDGQVRPTADGEAFLESDLPDVLVEKMLERVFPFAAFLTWVTGGRYTLKEMKEWLRKTYPNWTEDVGPSHIVAWARDLDLIEKGKDDRFGPTNYGTFWAKRVPQQLPPGPSAREGGEGEDIAEGFGATPLPEPGLQPAWPGIEQIVAEFAADPETSKFVFDPLLVRSLHHAFHCNPRKRFVILSGLSGTGKTAVMLCYARVVCKLLKLDEKQHRQLVAVSPDWQDQTGLLGYLNALHEEPTFQIEPALRLVLAAASDPARPYFLFLDEMNLARVERYFAPFLSAMETGDDLRLHGEERPINGVPSRVPWPKNLFIAGTVNMDETTHGFSDKVLDRAFALEFWSVDLEAFFARRGARDATTERVLLGLNAILAPIRRHFGYRAAGEILNFVAQAGDAPTHRAELLDQAIYAKVLPRIRGEDGKALRAALEKLRLACQESSLPRSAAKLTMMAQTLEQVGVTRFWS